MGFVVLNGANAGGSSALGAGKRTVADLKLNYIFAARLELLRNGKNIKCGFGIESLRKPTWRRKRTHECNRAPLA